MTNLSAPDASALLDFAAELHALDDPLPFPPHLLARLARLIPADEVGYSEVDPAARRTIVNVWHDADGEEGVVFGDDVWWAQPSDRELFWSVRDTHPICAHRRASGDWTTPYKVSDFATVREFRNTPVYQAFSDWQADYCLDVCLADTPTFHRGFAFWKLTRDFSERDRLVLGLLQPHLAARAAASATAAEAVEALAALEELDGGCANLVVLCSGNGVIEYASPASRTLLARYIGIDDGSVPTALLARRELLLRLNGSRLRVRVARTDNLHVLLLDERDLRVETLTTREREILDHVASGKQNNAIALELGVAPATVEKHLENIYRKLGVTNRTAAAAALKVH